MHARALHIYNNIRIPHHTDPDRWLERWVLYKSLMVALALALIYRSRLFAILLPLSLFTAALSALQILSGNEQLLLLLPWRSAVFLAPIASALIIGRTTQLLFPRRFQGNKGALLALTALSVALMASAVVSEHKGFRKVLSSLGRQGPTIASYSRKRDFVDHVRKNLKNGQVYLIPVKLNGFRIATGAPAFVGWKSIPFGDGDIIEWHQRIKLARKFYTCGTSKRRRRGLLRAMEKHQPVTHVVMANYRCPKRQRMPPVLKREFRGHNFNVYAVKR